MYVINKEPGIQIDLMVKRKYLPQLVGYIERMGCGYKKEITRELKALNEEWVTLKDISSENGAGIGQLLGLYYSMDWQALAEGAEDKFYILIHKARGKRHGGKNRKKAGSGREAGAGEGSAGDIQHAEPAGDGGDGDRLWDFGPDGVRFAEKYKSAYNGRCE